MKLYFHPISAYSQKVLIALYEKNATFEKEIIELTSPDAVAAWKKVYPLGKIPVLVDGENFVPESSIIVEFLETAAGGTALIPRDPVLARKTRFHDRTNDLYLTDPVVTLLRDGFAPPDRRNPAAVAEARATLDITYRHLDKHLANKTWFMGSDFTMADCSAAPALFYARQAHPFNAYPNIVAYAARVAERPSVRRVTEEAAPLLAKILGK